jgi:thioesterase domain-containing protein
MLAVELSFLVEREFGHEIPLRQFVLTPTLAEMASSIEDAAAGRKDGGSSHGALVQVRKGDTRRPLLLWVPGQGGTTLAAKRFASRLHEDVEVMGFEAPPHRGLPEPATMAAMATDYADDVRELARAGIIGEHRSFVLGGFSFGATLAHEVARVLFDDCPPAAVILADPLLAPLPARRSAKRRRRRRVARLLVRHSPGWVRFVGRRIRRRRQRVPVPAGQRSTAVEQVVRMSSRLRETHVARPYPGSVVLVSSAQRRQQFDDDLIGVRPFVVGDIVPHALPGRHGTMLDDERVEQIAAVVDDVVRNLPH